MNGYITALHESDSCFRKC